MTTKFSINGKAYTVNLANLPADITLNTFIREHAGLTATKFMCQEGGCGVCICAVTGKHPATGEVRTWAVNSCLTLLNTCAGLEITTSEGLGNKRDGYHPIQKRLAKMNGTQCGYCSPGIVMNMYALLEANGGKLTMAEIENAFGGNICRCTGYRPILDAMKSFAVDSNLEIPDECRDIEDLAKKTCPKTGERCSGTCSKQSTSELRSVDYNDGSQWFWPQTIAQVFEAYAQLKSKQYLLVAGNTAHGVYRRPTNIRAFIDVNAIPELSSYSIDAQALTLGANLSLTEAMAIFKDVAVQPGYEYCQQLWQHLDWIANVPVRNAGTLAGNLTIKHDHPEFPSDVHIVFEALDVKLVINENATTARTISLAEYLKTPMDRKLVTKFILKPYPKETFIFDSYKIMPRAQNAHAYVNAAFLINIDPATSLVKSARICFGGINPKFTHAESVEHQLVGQKLFDENLIGKLFSGLKKELQADAVLPDASPAYREKLAYSLFYKTLLKHTPKHILSESHITGGQLLSRPVSSGKQSFETFERNYPVTKPTEKHEGLIQTSGEATYVNDLPTQHIQVWAAFVTAKKVGATVTKIDATKALALPGVVAFFDYTDVPGENYVCPKTRDGFLLSFMPEREELFATGPIKFFNQPIGVIVAESNALANRAADLVEVTYEGGSDVVLARLEDVLQTACPNRIEQPIKSDIKELKLNEKHDFAASGKLELGLQYHYYMEPQTTVIVPFEGGLQAYVSTQWMDLTQVVIANVLNIKTNEVHVKTRRLGGGYGGKATRCNLVAGATAVAAYKLNRPVRFVQSLESIMNVFGKRWAFHCDYDFYVKKNGKIVGIRSTFYEDAGYLPNESPLGHVTLLSKNCYEFSNNFKIDGHIILTDSPTNTPCRAPGSVEGIAMIENIIEHIAFETGLDPVDVRLANMLPGHKISEMLPHFLQSSNYRARRADIIKFNKSNRWRKRGLGLCVMEYAIGYFGQYPATVAIYHSDGTVVVSHGGIEMGQGMNTKIVQIVAHTLGIPLENIKVEASDTINGANSMITGGAVGSETLCFAVRKCCDTLNERLQPVKEELKKPTWQDIINEAYNRKINLIASDQCKQGDLDPYTVCGLCLTEVELDVLTGNYLINRVDILEDTGESLNPNVDIGQIEGAFMMGLGYWTSEQIIVDKETGECLTNRTWTYKPPGAKDIPIDLRIELLKKSPNKGGFMRSKATGEPAICLAIAIAFALQHALQSARDDAGVKKSWVTLKAPMTPELLVQHAGTDINMLKLK